MPPAAGDGLTTATAYQITELGNLVWLSEQAAAHQTDGKYYTMMNDIDALGTATWNDAGTTSDTLEGFQPIGTYTVFQFPDTTSFQGVFDGNGHNIIGLTINRPATDKIGLFGSIGSSGVVRDLGLEGGVVRGRSHVGGLVGESLGIIVGCYSTCDVTGGDTVGGLVGFCQLVTQNYNAVIARCYATGEVTGSDFVGGLIGAAQVPIADCFASGAVMGTGDSVGGLAGSQTDTWPVARCYAVGPVISTHSAGGLIGGPLENWATTDSYWDVAATGQAGSRGGTGLATAQMKRQATFARWDFGSTWGIAEGASYPYLRFSPPPFRLTVAAKGPGTTAPAGAGTYAAGTAVPLSATPAGATARFFRWTGTVQDRRAAQTVVTMDIHRNVTAHFGVLCEIRTLADLQAAASGDLGGNYTLMNDIDASATAAWNDAGTTTDTFEGFQPIGSDSAPFLGVFDGRGHTILGLTIDRPDSDYVGLFGYIADGAQVRNLGLVGGSVTGRWNTGAMAGRACACTVENCYAGASVLGGGVRATPSSPAISVGGLIGSLSGGALARCYGAGTVDGYAAPGVLVLVQHWPWPTTWYPGYPCDAGGLVGTKSGGVLADCYATGRVTGHAAPGTVYRPSMYGGSSIGAGSPCYAGGLVGSNLAGTVATSYATGATVGITAAYTNATAGGLIASSAAGTTITASYWDTQTTSQTTSAGGTGKTTAEMKQQATFVGWDFWAVWGMAADFNDGYPYLRIPGGPYGTPNKPANPRPPDGAAGQALDVTLSWQDGGGAASYDVYLGTANPPVTRVATAQTETSYSPPSSLGYGTTYFWRIDAKNAAGTTAGDVWRFTTVPAPVVPGHFLARRVKSAHSEKWDSKGARIVAKDAYSFSAKMQLPVDSLASISNATTLTLVLGDAVTSGAACVVIERPLSAATKSTLAGHPTAKKPKDPTRGGSVTFVELQPNSKKKARVVTIKWTKTGVLTATVVGAPASANWDPANPAQRREVENIADLCDGAEWPEGVATGVAVPTLVDLSGVFIGADTVACGGKKSVKPSDGGDLVGWSVSGKK